MPPTIATAFLSSLPRRVARLQTAARAHPRRVAAATLVTLGGFAATAFGVAPMTLDDIEPGPARIVAEDVRVDAIGVQLEALAAQPMQLVHSDVTRKSDGIDALLRRLGVADAAAAAHLRSDADARRVVEGAPGKMVEATTARDGRLLKLVARYPALDERLAATHFTRLTVERRGDGSFGTTLQTAELQRTLRLGSGTARHSIWAAIDAAGLPEAIAGQMISVFANEIDFHRQIRRGDRFSVVYEALLADDRPIAWSEATGRIVAAEFVNAGRRHQAMWFPDAHGGSGAYFGFDGRSRSRAFLPSPVEFSRVTSGFSMRQHPIFQDWRSHNGVDYAAPVGTPVKAVAAGTVEFAGRQNGYGNVVQIAHAGGRTTLYAHLNDIAVQVGQKLGQGEVVGSVGMTGWTSGPHLHFELRVGGEHVDPLTVVSADEKLTVEPQAKARFAQLAASVRGQLAAAQSMIGFDGEAE